VARKSGDPVTTRLSVMSGCPALARHDTKVAMDFNNAKHVLFLEARYDCTLAVPVHRAKINIRSSRIFARTETERPRPDCLCGEEPLQEKKMRILAVIFGAAAAVAVAGPVSADPAAGRVQLAQAQDSGSQSGSGMSKSQQ